MNPEANKYLSDIIASIETIDSHLSDIATIAEYSASKKTVDAVERRIAIIGEALRKASALDGDLNISNKSKIIGLRNILTHDYDLIDDETIWIICKKYLPQLKREILGLGIE